VLLKLHVVIKTVLITFALKKVLIDVYLYACVRVCYSRKSKSIKRNRMKFGGMIGYYPGTI